MLIPGSLIAAGARQRILTMVLVALTAFGHLLTGGPGLFLAGSVLFSFAGFTVLPLALPWLGLVAVASFQVIDYARRDDLVPPSEAQRDQISP